MEIEKEFVVWGLGVIVAAATAALGIRRKYLRDNSEETTARSGHAAAMWWREEAQQQRERADIAFAERNKAMEELGDLRASVKFLKARVEQLETQVAMIQNGTGHS